MTERKKMKELKENKTQKDKDNLNSLKDKVVVLSKI